MINFNEENANEEKEVNKLIRIKENNKYYFNQMFSDFWEYHVERISLPVSPWGIIYNRFLDDEQLERQLDYVYLLRQTFLRSWREYDKHCEENNFEYNWSTVNPKHVITILEYSK